MKQSGESLAGRIETIELNPLDCLEIESGKDALTSLWIRGGFPDSFLAVSDENSMVYRRNFIRTYLERDVPHFGPRIPAETLERLVKSPKVYVRDSGLLHALLGIGDFEKLAGHPGIGSSWEGFVIENILSAAPESTRASFFRTAAGAEVDLVLELPGHPKPWAIEIKQSSIPKASRGFHESIRELRPEKAFILYAGEDQYPVNNDVDAIGLRGMCELLNAAG